MSVVVQNAAGAQGELVLPNIPGQLIIPTFLSIVCGAPPSANELFVGISHEKDADPTTSDLAIMEDPNVWLLHAFEADTNQVSQHFDLRDYGIAVGGSQGIRVVNDGANAIRVAVRMWYDTFMIDIGAWNNIASRTSFERV